ncbi:MAG: hypothetical protein Q8P29_03045 [Candidatus Levybacteria bacterium]|nr:hypothetical protein [Candidatus Levybacteria bacterium]MDZ4228288.1 hypothetical protein [Candidatus Levybacteria bacterium]
MSPERRHRWPKHPKEQSSFLQGTIHDAPDLILFSTPLRKDLAHPLFTGEKSKIELPTHTIKKDTIIVGPSSNGPARVKALQDAFVIKLEKQKMANHPAFKLTANLLVWKIGKEAIWTLIPGKIISCYASEATKISKKKLKEMESIAKLQPESTSEL